MTGNPLVDPTMNRQLGGSLIYHTMVGSNNAYVVQVVTQFIENLHKINLTVVYHILRYIRGIVDWEFLFITSSTHPCLC